MEEAYSNKVAALGINRCVASMQIINDPEMCAHETKLNMKEKNQLHNPIQRYSKLHTLN
jgi:hypothetical protein